MRPKKERVVNQPPVFKGFKPVGVRRKDIETIVLKLDEFEAIRLADLEGFDHNDAAEFMKISRPTFSRLIEKARQKMADFLINGKYLTIDGGNIHFYSNRYRCRNCGAIFQVRWLQNIESCPHCGSTELENLAKIFGHGRCCRNRHGRR